MSDPSSTRRSLLVGAPALALGTFLLNPPAARAAGSAPTDEEAGGIHNPGLIVEAIRRPDA